ncbi:aldehyde dehydrogenase family protein [Dongia deserti]|uniref:aldehyde dehydrogenase family protein n=1 Tax=Dongia deserti TaxID=2268030 RepID=UPI000E655D1D|nr:aldehyde dehydrogenase family protein [Dongia deserti]
MSNHRKFYINGAWVDPIEPRSLDVINPATEETFATISIGSAKDVDRAVAAARAAFPQFSQSTKSERVELLQFIIGCYRRRLEDFAQAVSVEVGAPIGLARNAQAAAALMHLEATLKSLEGFVFEEQRGTTRVLREPIGVAGLITPWNWPLNQIACKVAPAIAAGCTMVLKPSEVAPITGIIFSEVMHEAGVPAGVYNMVNGDGASVGHAMSGHPDIDMISFTGSTRAGIMVAKNAADTVKRVTQELGGKSPNIILRDTELVEAVTKGVQVCFVNSGQSCNAPTRMLVPREKQREALAVAKAVAEAHKVGDPRADDTVLGPVVSEAQFNKIQQLISAGIREGATLVTGGIGRPEGLNRGYYVRPTVFGDVESRMTIAREEIFGPVLSIMPYDTENQAIEIANGTVYGLSACVASKDIERAREVARRIRAGQVKVNYPAWDTFSPFGGYKQSGNGREYADWGIHEFLEIKGIVGYGSPQ